MTTTSGPDASAPATPPATGRRERKKAETREALRGAARRLFAEQGYANTTVEQISEAADVSERTFFRYFEAKDDLLLPDLTDFFLAIEAGIAQRPAGEDPLESYRAALVGVLASQQVRAFTRVAPGIDPRDPAVATRLVRAFVEWEDRLAAIMADRVRAAHPELEEDAAESFGVVAAGIAAATTRAVNRLVRRRHVADDAERIALIDGAFGVLRGERPGAAATG